MNILLFSDSHGNVNNMVKAVRKSKKTDLIIHLGDYVRDAQRLQEIFPYARIEAVQGNNDWTREYPSEKMLDIEGKKIFITHGHHYNVKYDYQRIIQKGKALNADAVFFGHTHTPEEMFADGMLVLNPGSAGSSFNSGSPTYCYIEIADGRIISRFYGLG